MRGIQSKGKCLICDVRPAIASGFQQKLRQPTSVSHAHVKWRKRQSQANQTTIKDISLYRKSRPMSRFPLRRTVLRWPFCVRPELAGSASTSILTTFSSISRSKMGNFEQAIVGGLLRLQAAWRIPSEPHPTSGSRQEAEKIHLGRTSQSIRPVIKPVVNPCTNYF